MRSSLLNGSGQLKPRVINIRLSSLRAF